MKRLLLLVIFALGAFYAYSVYFPSGPTPAPAVAPAVAPDVAADAATAAGVTAGSKKSERVSLANKSRVRRLLEAWRHRKIEEIGGPGDGSASVNAVDELKDIRRTLYAEGKYSDAELQNVVVSSLRELGVAEGEINEVATGILGLR